MKPIGLHDPIWKQGIGLRTLLLNALLLPLIICAPPLHQSNVYDNLYENASKENCHLPKVVEHSDYISLKVNLACNVTTNKSGSTPPPSNICQSLSDLFPKLCNASFVGEVPSEVNTAVDLKDVSNMGTETFCKKIQEVFNNISHDNEESWKTSPFPKEAGKEKSCDLVCKNIPVLSIFSGDTFEISPECILLFEGYNIIQKYQLIRKVEAKQAQLLQKVSPAPAVPVQENIIIPPDAENKKLKQEIIQNKDKQANAVDHNREGVLSPLSNGYGKLEENIGQPTTAKQSVTPSNHIVKEPAKIDLSSKKPVEQKLASGFISSSSTSTTQSASNNGLNLSEDDPVPLPPNENDQKLKTSTAIPNNNEMQAQVVSQSSKSPSNQKVSVASASKDKIPVSNTENDANQEVVKSKIPSSTKKIADQDNMAGLEAEDDYNSGEEPDVDIQNKPPLKSEKNEDMEIPPVAAAGYDTETVGKISVSKKHEDGNRFSGNAFSGDLPFANRGTTINVSLNETEDTGFFSYFLFGVTLSGLVYLIFHNKKKLIAYVVEGRRPGPRGGRSRRSSSSSSQYRRLENNYD